MQTSAKPVVLCAVDGCLVARRKRDWCGRHYQAWRRHGSPTVARFEWAPKSLSCVLCGKTEIPYGFRSYCSSACRQAAYNARRRGWEWKKDRQCERCGTSISLIRVEGKYVRNVHRRFCAACKAPRRSHRIPVLLLAHYQGTACGICGSHVDMALRHPDEMCATVDHKIPLARGGTDEVENLQLAHSSCNNKKRARY